MVEIITPNVAKEINGEIAKNLDKMGLMYRIFYREKSTASLNKKISKDKEYGLSKKIQDIVGIRIALYFSDDVKLVHNVLSSIFQEIEKDRSIDEYGNSKFCPVRYNLVYKIPDNIPFTLANEYEKYVDRTFEIQIRTVLSEGWHEVEHDFRYKCIDDWSNYDVESRKLNGVYASLETSEWTMLKIFDELAYGHYKNKSWESMLRQKLRLRTENSYLSSDISKIFNEEPDVGKMFYRLDRSSLISMLAKLDWEYPMTIDNIVYLSNLAFIKSEKIHNVTPNFIIQEFNDQFTNI
ncbi:RelA/SpoT domain-containing protein [Shewanella indica]|uniref:RelA/SpoT domain-containing protein n=1 Tax=Shewanella indica TaxID=768528 RepID=UPI001CFCFBBE|nr:RelA/SpoT domain-containing protein [Shewanella indica]